MSDITASDSVRIRKKRKESAGWSEDGRWVETWGEYEIEVTRPEILPVSHRMDIPSFGECVLVEQEVKREFEQPKPIEFLRQPVARYMPPRESQTLVYIGWRLEMREHPREYMVRSQTPLAQQIRRSFL